MNSSSTIRQWLAVIGVAAAPHVSQAETLHWRQVSHLNDTHVYTTSDSGAYTVGAARGNGLAFFPSGEVATVSLQVSIDYVRGEGDFLGYEVYEFRDGSGFTLRRVGRTRNTNQGATAEFDGSFDILSGKGRYAQLKGKGKFTGRRAAPLNAGADQYFDYDLAQP